MKIAVVAPSPVPFTPGGAEQVWAGITKTLAERTPHDVELIKLPTLEHSLPDLLASYEKFAALDLRHFDVVISGKYPAWMVQHQRHVVYMLHPLRGLYDTYPPAWPITASYSERDLLVLQSLLTPDGDQTRLEEVFARAAAAVGRFGAGHPAFAFPGPLARELVHYFDSVALHRSRIHRYLAISRTVAGRPNYFPAGADVEVAYPPPNLGEHRSEGFDYVFTASRLDAPKRLDLLIKSVRRAPDSVRLKIAGTGPELSHLQSVAGGDPRIELLGRVDVHQLIELYANARLVAFIPRDEDLGLVTLEAMQSAKPVVTTADAGGPTELVEDGITGVVTDANADALGAAISRLWNDVELCRRLGAEGRRRSKRITWPSLIETLLASPAPATLVSREPVQSAPPAADWRRRDMPKLVVPCTFPVYPRRGGGQIRCHALYGALTPWFDVEIVSLVEPHVAPQQVRFGPGFFETAITKSAEQARFEAEESARAGITVTDIVASRGVGLTPAYGEALEAACRDADALLLAHPYLYPAARELRRDLPVIYDAHNFERGLKAAILGEQPSGLEFLHETEQIERDAARDAVLISACSEEDADAISAAYAVDRARISVVPNGVDTLVSRFVGSPQRERHRAEWLERFDEHWPGPRMEGVAVFLGSWHPPNLEAAECIFGMAPRLPHTLFAMMGSHCDYFASARKPSNVILLGEVSEAIKGVLLSIASAALNPMITGGGTNLKLIEYMASGAPVVTTPSGARGTHSRSGVHVLAVPMERFVQALREVLANPDEAAARAVEARALVEREFDWSRLGVRFAAAISAVLDERVIKVPTDTVAPTRA
jgi:glycosyltransferase involved in cell wall biosynthesis